MGKATPELHETEVVACRASPGGLSLGAWRYNTRVMFMLFLTAAVAGCCRPLPPSDWPSLALRTGEAQTLVSRPAAGGAVASAPPPPPPVALADAAARRTSLERDMAAYAKRLQAQVAESGARPADEDAAATAQLELTRLDRLSSQGGDLREQLNELAGDLARQAAAGSEVGAELALVGADIDKVEALRADQAKAAATAEAALKK